MALGHVDVGVEGIEVGDVVDRRAVGDRGADVEVAGEHRRRTGADHGSRELELGELEGVLGVLGPPAGLEFVLADQALIVETGHRSCSR